MCENVLPVQLSFMLRDNSRKENYGKYLGNYLTEKTQSIFRYTCCNIHGLNLQSSVPKDDKSTTICQEINATGIDIMGMSEISTNVMNNQAQDIVKTCLKKILDHVVYAMSSGEMQLSYNRIVGWLLLSYSDAMGRWLIQKIQGADDRVITFISVISSLNLLNQPSTHRVRI